MKCNGCNKEFPESCFISNRGLKTTNCLNCRQRYNKSKEKHKEKQLESTNTWKENNSEYVSFMNTLYNQTKDMPTDERKLLTEKLKKENGYENQVVGKPSNHRKEHYTKDDIVGKDCSISGCGWKPLTDFNYDINKWDKLRTTCKSCMIEQRKKNRDKNNINYNKRMASDPEFRIRETLKTRLHGALKYQNNTKKDNTVKYLGCTIEYFKKFIEEKFTDDMTWDKHGYYYDNNNEKQMGFHLDHIIPCAAFDLTKEDEVYLCFYYKNYQPMWGKENISKWAKFIEQEKLDYINSVKDEIFGNKQIVIKPKEIFMKEILEDPEVIEKEIKANKLLDEYIETQSLLAIQVMFFVAEKEYVSTTTKKTKQKKNNTEQKKQELLEKLAATSDTKSTHTEKSESTKLKMALGQIGRKPSEETLLKIQATRKYGADNIKSKKVCKLSLDDKLLETYDSMSEAAQKNNTYHSSISNCCSGKKKTSGGFKWCFSTETD